MNLTIEAIESLRLGIDKGRLRSGRQGLARAGRFREPLHRDDYSVHFKKVMPGCQKGGLSAAFVTLASLGNLNRHLSQMPAADQKEPQVERTFAMSMLDKVSRWYAIPGRIQG